MSYWRARARRVRWSVACAAALLAASSAHGRARGIVVDGCSGCHGNLDESPPQLSLRAEPATFGPGDSVTFTLEIRRASVAVGGAYITAGTVGALRALPGGGLTAQGQGLVHSAVKQASGGVVSFNFGWQAPSTPGAVHFHVAALAGNGNNASSGDSPGYGGFDWTYGCEAAVSYVDLDRDGYGTKALGTKLRCEDEPPEPGFAAVDGDCDENDENANPSGVEVCNKKDDDCDGQVDEGAAPVELWPEQDGDGYYSVQRGTPKIGCGNLPGYAAAGGDCDDFDAAVHPNAVETCNGRDDNCDLEADERVRPVCGVGWCARYSPTCNALDCQPGLPREELCNAFDDDCDGELDNGACQVPPCSGADCGTAGSGGTSTAGSGSNPPAGGGPAPAAGTGGAGAVAKQSSPGCALGGAPESLLAWPFMAMALTAFRRTWRASRRGPRAATAMSQGRRNASNDAML